MWGSDFWFSWNSTRNLSLFTAIRQAFDLLPTRIIDQSPKIMETLRSTRSPSQRNTVVVTASTINVRNLTRETFLFPRSKASYPGGFSSCSSTARSNPYDNRPRHIPSLLDFPVFSTITPRIDPDATSVTTNNSHTKYDSKPLTITCQYRYARG